MTINFAAEAAPTKPRENEFRDFVKAMAAKPETVFSYVVTAENIEKAKEKVAADKRKMAEAGNELTTVAKVPGGKEGETVDKIVPAPVTVRTVQTEEQKDKKSIKVWVKATKKVRRVRKEK